MLSTLLLLGSLAAPHLGAGALPPTTFPVQDEDLEALLDEYEEALKDRESSDQAIALMDRLTSRFKTTGERLAEVRDDLELGQGDAKALKAEAKTLEKELDAIAEAVHRAFVHKRRKRVTQENLRLWTAAAYALGQMGERGAKYLWKAFEDKKFKKEPDFRGLLLEQIGYTHAYDYADELMKQLDSYEYLFIAKAADALAQFAEAPGEVRREIVGTMVKLYAQNYEDALQNQNDPEKQEKYRKTSGSMARALEALTGTQQRDPVAWNRWWNEHKKDDSVWTP